MIDVVFYEDGRGGVPVLEWLDELRKTNKKAYAKCRVRIERLAEMGHLLRRPETDYVEDDIRELRARVGKVQYRMLYFFHGQERAVLVHALTKEDAIPESDLNRARSRKHEFEADPGKHSYEEEVEDDG